MKTCEEMTRDVLARVHAYEAQAPVRRKKRLLMAAVALSLACVLLCATGILYTRPGFAVPQLGSPHTGNAQGMLVPFDVSWAVSGNGKVNTATFTGTVRRIRRYYVFTKGADGRLREPDEQTLIDVTVTGSCADRFVPGDTVTVWYPLALPGKDGWTEDSPEWIFEEGGEYLFACCMVIGDESYAAYKDSIIPGGLWRNAPLLDKADVELGALFYFAFPVENDTVFIYSGYFENDPDALAQAIPPEQIETDSFHPLSLQNRVVLAYDRATFTRLFADLLAEYGRGEE